VGAAFAVGEKVITVNFVMFSSLPPLPSFLLRVLLALGSGLLIAGLL